MERDWGDVKFKTRVIDGFIGPPVFCTDQKLEYYVWWKTRGGGIFN